MGAQVRAADRPIEWGNPGETGPTYVLWITSNFCVEGNKMPSRWVRFWQWLLLGWKWTEANRQWR